MEKERAFYDYHIHKAIKQFSGQSF